MVFSPFYPKKDMSQLSCGFIMIVTGLMVIVRNYSNSKNKIIYAIMTCTVLLGCSLVGLACCEAFVNC